MYLERTSTAKDIRSKIIELLHDEDKLHESIYLVISTTTIPHIGNHGELQKEEAEKILFESLDTKAFFEKQLIRCQTHLVYLNKKLVYIKNSTGLEGVKPSEMFLFMTQFKNWIMLFTQFTTILKSKIHILEETIKTSKILIGE